MVTQFLIQLHIVLMPSQLPMLHRLPLPLYRRTTNPAHQLEPTRIHKLLLALQFPSQEQAPLESCLVIGLESSYVGFWRKVVTDVPCEGVVVDSVVEDEDSFGVLLSVDFMLEELDVDYTYLDIIMLR